MLAADLSGQELVFLVAMQVLCGLPNMSQEPFPQLSFWLEHTGHVLVEKVNSRCCSREVYVWK